MKKLLIIIFAIGITAVISGCAHHYHHGSAYNGDGPSYRPRHYGYSGYRRPYGYPPVNNHWRGHHHHHGYRPYY